MQLRGLDLYLLPQNARELVDLVGVVPALALVENFGGLTLRIPLGETARGRAMLEDMARHAGEDAAEAISRQYGGSSFYIPNCKLALVKARDALMIKERAERAAKGESERGIVMALARKYRLSDRYVWRLLKKPFPAPPKPPSGQARLPGC